MLTVKLDWRPYSRLPKIGIEAEWLHSKHKLASNCVTYIRRVKGWLRAPAPLRSWCRAETDEKMRERISHDLDDIKKWSIVLDLQILVRTIFSVIRGDKAY